MAAASSNAPRMRGCAGSKSRQISFSGRRRASEVERSVRKIARSARSGRVMTSSMPLRMIGTGSLKQHFISVGVELANRKAAPARESAQRIGQPSR